MLFKKWKPECNSTSIAISSQSGCVVSGTENCQLIVWDLSTGTQHFRSFRTHTNVVSAVSYSGDKRHILKNHTSPVDVLKISEKANRLLSYDSTGKDKTIRIWNLDNGM